jgi:hypothetical protein
MVTYVNDLRLSELATGEGSGTWGTTTNTNLELIGEALGYGTEQSFSSDADATTTIGDGVSDPARAMYFKVTSAGSLTATRTLTIAPNTVSRVMFIENATTGSQSIAISQGSGASVTILTGKTAVVYLDGAGATAAVVDAMALVDPGVTDTLTEVLVAGNTSGGTNIELSTTDKVQFRDAAIYLNSSVDGQLDIVADTEIQIAATTIDVNGTLAFDSLKGTGATTVTNILDEDNMASDSATAIATQQSIKAYVDSQVGSFDTLAEVLAQGNTTGGTDLAVSAGDDITFTDTSKAIFGAGSDLQIGHDGSVSFITDSGTGDLYIQGSSAIRLTNPAGNETFAVFNDNGAASLYYDNGVSLSTTATGIDVTGSVTADGLVVDGASSGSTVATFTANANVDTPLLVFQRSGGAVAGKIAYDDTNTAITFGTTTNHEVRFLTNNTEKMQLTADGNVGIGVSAPAYKIDATTTSGGNGIKMARGADSFFEQFQSATGGIQLAASGSVAFMAFRTGTTAGTTTEAMRIDASGSVGIGSSGALTSTYLSKAFVYTAGGANFALGGSSDTNDAVLSRFTSYNVANSNSGNQDSGNFYGVTSIESIVVTTDSNAGDDSGGSLLFKTKPEAGALAERLRIDAAGNLLVGVAGTNNGRLDINTGSGTYIIDAINAAGGRYFAVDKGAPVNSFIVDSSGNVGIGLDGGYSLDVLNTTANAVSARFTATDTSSTEYGPIIILTNDPNDTTRYFLEGAGGGTARFRIYSNGNMVNQNNSYTAISDEKLKENIVDAGSQWDDIKALRVRKYSFKEENASEPTQIGVIAQEVEAAGMSGLVYETADQDTAEDGSFVDTGEVTKTMKYSILYMKAVKALQEAMDRIETLEAKVSALES